jgi:5-deoxy-glucuronate isomerase
LPTAERIADVGELTTIASPDLGNSRFLSLLRLELQSRDVQRLETGDQEHVVNLLSGRCTATIMQAGSAAVRYGPIGERADIFSGRPELVYVPRESVCEIECLEAPLEAVIYTAPTDEAAAPAYVAAEQVQVIASGVSDWKRQVFIGIGEEGPATRMMVGETESPPGNWSGFPPHRHTDDNPPNELAMEELYYFHFYPRSGFVIGGTYQDSARKEQTAELSIYRHGQAFGVPCGYHFIAPCPGYRVRYTWALGGRRTGFGAWTDDPDLAWLNDFKG